MPTDKYYGSLVDKNKMYRNHFIAYVITFIPCILALIGFNLLLVYPSFNPFLTLLLATIWDYVFFINGFLIMFDSLIGLFLVHALRGFIITKRKLLKLS